MSPHQPQADVPFQAARGHTTRAADPCGAYGDDVRAPSADEVSTQVCYSHVCLRAKRTPSPSIRVERDANTRRSKRAWYAWYAHGPLITRWSSRWGPDAVMAPSARTEQSAHTWPKQPNPRPAAVRRQALSPRCKHPPSSRRGRRSESWRTACGAFGASLLAWGPPCQTHTAPARHRAVGYAALRALVHELSVRLDVQEATSAHLTTKHRITSFQLHGHLRMSLMPPNLSRQEMDSKMHATTRL